MTAMLLCSSSPFRMLMTPVVDVSYVLIVAVVCVRFLFAYATVCKLACIEVMAGAGALKHCVVAHIAMCA